MEALNNAPDKIALNNTTFSRYLMRLEDICENMSGTKCTVSEDEMKSAPFENIVIRAKTFNKNFTDYACSMLNINKAFREAASMMADEDSNLASDIKHKNI
ncbi:MAG: hypothetical protein SPL99_04910 [Catonella sp.]|nr:hypothetical protein [Catonella sp.]MDY6355716.1 hypothetical protein [Catonella sp.]